MTRHHVMTVRDFVNMIKEQRASGEFKISAICNKAGVARQSVYRLMEGSTCTVQTLDKLAGCFGAQVVVTFPSKRPKGPQPPPE